MAFRKASRPTSAATDREPRGGLGGHQANRIAISKRPPRQAASAGVVIRAEIVGDTCTAAGLTVQASAPVLALCRVLIARGHDPTAPLEAWRGDVLSLRVRSIGEGAKLRTATHGIGFERLEDCTGAPPVRVTPAKLAR